MSLISSLWKGVRSVAAPAIGAAIGGPIGGIAGTLLAGSSARSSFAPAATIPAALPSLPMLGGAVMRALPGIGGAVVAGGARMAGTAMRGAISLCRKHPQWCSTIGGTAAVAAMMESGQLPVPRRRRSRGITGSEFRAFRRVHGVLAKFCAPKMKIKRSKASCR